MQAQVEAETKDLASKVDQVKKEKTVSTQAPKPMEPVGIPQWSTSALFGLQLCSSGPMHNTPVLAELFVLAAPDLSTLLCVSRPAAVWHTSLTHVYTLL
jgi:hypothetical protein